jgi:hypothetical protein
VDRRRHPDPGARPVDHRPSKNYRRVIARLKDWQILRQCRRRADAIDHSLQIVAGLWNLKTRTRLRVKS